MGAQVAQEGAGWRTGAQKAQMAQVAQGGAWRRRKAQMVVQGGAHGAGWRKVTQTAQGWRMAAQGGAGGCMQEGMQVHWRRAAPVAQAVTAQSRPRMTPALKGLTTVPDFAYAFGKASELDCFCSDDYAQLWQDLQVEDPVHSPAMARLRRAHVRAPAVSLAEDTAPQPSTASPPAQPQINSWAEHAPPRLDASVIAQLTKDFKANYPGEFLDSDAMPSVRLLSIVHKWFAPQGTITWVPWQLRLSHKQYQEIIESKSSKMLRTEAQFLSTALFDETPEMPVEHLRLSPAWLSRIQTVFRNAIALCKGTHLARLKALDKKVLDASTQNPSDPSLRTVTTTELVAADRKIWHELALLHSTGWTLDDALHELTTVRADVANLLQLRAKPPPPPNRPPRKDPKGPGKGKTEGKTGKGNGAPTLKRKTPGDSTAREIKAGIWCLSTAIALSASVGTKAHAATYSASTCTLALSSFRMASHAGAATLLANTRALLSRHRPD
ncbi:unnamed protein product [Symbiodinium sp. KB8]|nr:unnamed protein product [Symbiodinium sp. KB8]